MKHSSVLLFDLGGVLVNNKAFDSLRSITGELVDDDVLRERWLRSPVVRAFELGQISATAFAQEFVAEWKVRVSPEDFLCEVRSWVEEPHTGAERLVTRLRGGYHVSCLSNCNELHWSSLASLLECFDSTFSSHLLGEVKPDEGAFQAVVSELGVEPAEVSFFDDSFTNVEAARRLGIQAFVVQGFGDLCVCLQNGGLL